MLDVVRQRIPVGLVRMLFFEGQEMLRVADLEEYLAKDPVRFFAEDGAEDNSHTVMACFDVDGFFLAVVDGHDFATFCDSFWR